MFQVFLSSSVSAGVIHRSSLVFRGAEPLKLPRVFTQHGRSRDTNQQRRPDCLSSAAATDWIGERVCPSIQTASCSVTSYYPQR